MTNSNRKPRSSTLVALLLASFLVECSGCNPASLPSNPAGSSADNTNTTNTINNNPPNQPAVTQEMINKVQAKVDTSGGEVFNLLLDVIKELKSGKKTKLNTKSISGGTPLWAAIALEDLEIIKLLVDQGANINEVSYQNETALYRATDFIKEDIIDYLLSKGADKSIASTDSGYTPYEKVKQWYDAAPTDKLLERLVIKLAPS